MPKAHRQSLSSGDAMFLYFEREGQPVNVAAITVLEGKITLPDCTAFIAGKLRGIPRYLQRVVFPPLNLGLPAWEDDPEFDIRHHVRAVKLPRGTDAEFKAAVGKILSPLMDRRRPLWDLTLVQGLEGERTGLVVRIHHCLTDGISGVGILNALLDPIPVPPPRVWAEPASRHHQPKADELTALDGILNACQTIGQRVLTGSTELLSVAQELISPGKAVAGTVPGQVAGRTAAAKAPTGDELLRRFPELANAAERLPFNVVCRGPQKFQWTEIPLGDIKAVKEARGATVNDVILTVVTSAVSAYAKRHKVPLPGRSVRIAIPVNVRGNGDVSELGNRITFLPLSVPMDIDDPGELLTTVHERVLFSRAAGLPELVGIFGTWLGAIPTALQAVIGPLVSQLPLSVCNLICTNVPGPQQPLYLFGHQVLSMYPYVPIGGEMGMNCAIMTYNGTAFFGFSGDAHAVPDLEFMEGAVRASFQRLREAAGVGSPKPKRARAKTSKRSRARKTRAPEGLSKPSVSEPAVPPQSGHATSKTTLNPDASGENALSVAAGA